MVLDPLAPWNREEAKVRLQREKNVQSSLIGQLRLQGVVSVYISWRASKASFDEKSLLQDFKIFLSATVTLARNQNLMVSERKFLCLVDQKNRFELHLYPIIAFN